jgi:hypothetical protein
VAATENGVISSDENNSEDSSTDASANTTTKGAGQPTGGNKKRKNNKNRRRRPGNKPEATEDAESKTGDTNTTVTKPPVGTKERPLSTRIYNYLAREVMPSVGVGLIGLVVTAGLAGLIMYPFGGGLAARRTHEEQAHPHQLHPGAYYHHGEYEGEIDNSQSEEEVFGKLLEGMNDNGEFTYSEIGDQATGYADVPGISRDHGSIYRTRGGSVDDGHTYNPGGITYGGKGRVDVETRGQYDSSQQGAAGFGGPGKNQVMYPYSHGSQQHYGSSVRADNGQEMYQYGGMTTREGGVPDSSVRESQHTYSGPVTAAKKHYAVGTIQLDGEPQQPADEQTATYGRPFYTPAHMESQAHALNAYIGWTATEGPVYGSVQGLRHSGTTEPETRRKTFGNSESNSAGSQQYRRGTPESKQQHRDGTGSQPRSGNGIMTGSVTREPSPRGIQEGPQTELFVEHEHTETFSRNKQSSSQRRHELRQNQDADVRTDGNGDSNKEPGGFLDASSGLSAEVQKREPIISGFVGHGPRSLRIKRDTIESTKLIVPIGNVRDNEIESNKLKHDEGSEIPTHSILENAVSVIEGTDIREGIAEAKVGKETREKETSTVSASVTNGPTEDTVNINTGTSLPGVSTLENELSTTTRSKDYDVGGEYSDVQEDDEEYDTTVSPEMTTASNESSTKAADVETTTKIPESEFSLLGLVRRIARFKLRMGLNLLKSTSQALTNYIERVQRRMDKDYDTTNGSLMKARALKRGT